MILPTILSSWVIFFPPFITVWNRREHQCRCKITETPLKAGNILQQEYLKLRNSLPKSREMFLLSYSLDVLIMVPGRDDESAQKGKQLKEKSSVFSIYPGFLSYFPRKILNRSESVLGLFVCLLWRVVHLFCGGF